jgi:hypothetical protein
MVKIKKNSTDSVILLDLGVLLDTQSFDSFKDIRKEAYTHIKEYREQFVKVVLTKHDIPYSLEMTKRERHALFEKHIVGIIHDEKSNYDKIYKEGNLIGYWNKDIKLRFVKGRLLARIQYKMF